MHDTPKNGIFLASSLISICAAKLPGSLAAGAGCAERSAPVCPLALVHLASDPLRVCEGGLRKPIADWFRIAGNEPAMSFSVAVGSSAIPSPLYAGLLLFLQMPGYSQGRSSGRQA
jgi:hypothetical protein